MSWQAVWFYRKTGRGFLFDGALIRVLIRTSIPFLISGTLGVIYYRIDTVLLSLMTNTAVVGWYGAGYRLFDTLIFIPSLIITPIMYPVFSRLSSATHAQLRLAVEKSLNFLLVCSVPIAVGMIVAAPNIIGFLYHRPEYVHTYAVLQGLAPGLVFLYANTVLNSVIISTQREKKIPLMAGIALVFNLGLNLALIPLYQHIAAAAVTSLTELLLLILSLFFTPRYLLPVESLRVAGKALFASVVMGIVIWLMGRFSILVIAPTALVVYVCMTLLLGTIPRNDIQALLGAIRTKRQRTSTVTASQEQDRQEQEERVAQRV
jgi:O-antigen/teichoic acid export membrane protein